MVQGWAETRLAEILCSDASCVVAMLEAYFDESERKSGVFCVAGYVFAPQQAKKFAKEWRDAHEGLLPSHMTDLATGGGKYRHMSPKERNALVQRSVEIINARISIGVVISCLVAEVARYSPRWIRGFGSPYSVCCHLAMHQVGIWLQQQRRPEKVAYIFEAGHSGRAEAHDLISAMRKNPEDPYRCYSHAFVPKESSLALQAADLLAWEWTKFMDETLLNPKRLSRRSLRALTHGHPERYKGVHFTGAPLQKFMAGIAELGREQIEEERRAK